MTGAVRDYGDQALLLECDSTAEVLAWAKAVKQADLPDIVDIVPAARTVLVTLAAPGAQVPTRQHLARLHVGPDDIEHRPAGGHADVMVDVVYDGADLDDVARLTGLTTGEVVAAHTGTPWRVGFGGFAPGFAYLVDGDARLDVPRRAEPRTCLLYTSPSPRDRS